jgi:hypothetical protein
MNSQEKQFVDSIKNKIKEYNIPTTLKEVLEYYTDTFIETRYIDGTTEQVDMGIEYRLCELSAYYFIVKYAYIEIPGIGTLPFTLYYFQEEILKLLPQLKKSVFNKTRQAGISTLTSVYCFWKGNFHDSENIDVISTKQSKAQAFVQKMDATYKNMPFFLRTPIKNKNMHGVKWENGSQIISETASETAGRGDSLSLLVLDEAAHYQSDRLTRGIIGAAMPTLSRTGGSLAIISTPNGTHGPGAYYYEQVNALQTKGNSRTERLIDIDWWEIPDIKGIEPYRGYNQKLQEFVEKDYFNRPLVKEEAKRFFKPIEENWRENDFLIKQYDDLGSVLFKQEIFHNFIIAEDQVFAEDIIEELREKIRDFKPLYEDELNGNSLKGLIIWNLPVPKKRYILSADIASGTGKDYSAVQILDVENYEQVAEYRGRLATKNFSKVIKSLARYYNQAFVVIEANSIGEAVFNEVYYSENDPYDNVYKQKKSRNGVTRFTGWETNLKTRQLMTNDLIDWINVKDLRDRLTIKSPRLLNEMITWVWKSGNKAEHQDNANDDLLISFGLCIHLRNKVTEYGESFFIGDDGTLFQFEESDKNRDISDSFGFETSEEIRQDAEDLIQEEYGIGIDEYKWLIG